MEWCFIFYAIEVFIHPQPMFLYCDQLYEYVEDFTVQRHMYDRIR